MAAALVLGSDVLHRAPNLDENPGFWTFHVAKNTQDIELLDFYLDGAGSALVAPGVPTYPVNPDGWVTMLLPESVLTAGSHTVEIKAETSALTVSAAIVQPTY